MTYSLEIVLKELSSSSISVTWELVRNAESQVLLQIYCSNWCFNATSVTLVLDGVWEPPIYSYRLFWLAPLHGFISKNPEIMFLPLALRPWCDNGFSLLLNPECLTIPCWFLNPDSHLLNIPFTEIFLARSFFFFWLCHLFPASILTDTINGTRRDPRNRFPKWDPGLGCSYICWVHQPPCMMREDTSNLEHEGAPPSLKTTPKWGVGWDVDGRKDIRR